MTINAQDTASNTQATQDTTTTAALYRFIPGDTSPALITVPAGSVLQAVMSNTKTGFVGKKAVLPQFTLEAITTALVAGDASSSVLLATVLDALETAQRATVLKSLILNGASAVTEEQASLPYLLQAISNSGVFTLTKSALTAIFDSLFIPYICARVVEVKKIDLSTFTDAEVLSVAQPSIDVARTRLLQLCNKQPMLTQADIDGLRRAVLALSSELPTTGACTSAALLARITVAEEQLASVAADNVL